MPTHIILGWMSILEALVLLVVPVVLIATVTVIRVTQAARRGATPP